MTNLNAWGHVLNYFNSWPGKPGVTKENWNRLSREILDSPEGRFSECKTVQDVFWKLGVEVSHDGHVHLDKMSLTMISFSNLDRNHLIIMAPSLPSYSRYLTVTNYPSGAYWMGYPKPPEMLFAVFGVKLIDLGDGYFALQSTDEGVKRFLSVDTNNAGYIRATSSTITKKEKFAVFAKREDIESNMFYLYSATGKFVTMVERVDEFGDTIYEAAATSETLDSRGRFCLFAAVQI